MYAYLAVQLHVKEFTWSMQDAPLTQGDEEHSMISRDFRKKDLILLFKGKYINNPIS